MKKQRKTKAGAGIILLMAALLCMPLLVQAGSLEPPSGTPAPTMRTLDEVYNQLLTIEGILGRGASPVSKTGQKIMYLAGDDGDLQRGVAVPIPRFIDNGNGTVTDNLTKLIWLKNANGNGATCTWANALLYCNTLASGSAGLTDGSVAGDWRMPNVKEFISLMDFSVNAPCLTGGHPFTSVQASYWASTTSSGDITQAFQVGVGANGSIGRGYKTISITYTVWPVRGGY